MHTIAWVPGIHRIEGPCARLPTSTLKQLSSERWGRTRNHVEVEGDVLTCLRLDIQPRRTPAVWTGAVVETLRTVSDLLRACRLGRRRSPDHCRWRGFDSRSRGTRVHSIRTLAWRFGRGLSPFDAPCLAVGQLPSSKAWRARPPTAFLSCSGLQSVHESGLKPRRGVLDCAPLNRTCPRREWCPPAPSVRVG